MAINGTDGNDTLDGTDGSDEINGLDGDDIIDPRGGADVVNGGAGNDTLKVSSVTIGSPPPTPTVFDGGTGFDTFDLSAFSLFPHAFWSYDSGNGHISVANYTMLNVERLVGSSSRDVFNFFTVNFSLQIEAGGGDDEIDGGSGSDKFYGGAGNDVLLGGGGADELRGESGDDQIYLPFGGGLVDGGTGVDLLYVQSGVIDLAAGLYQNGFGGTTALSGIENVRIISNSGSVTVRGDDGANVIDVRPAFGTTDNLQTIVAGGGGADVLTGAAGLDTLHGDDGADQLVGGAGADQLYGDADNDVLLGGAGNDRIDGGAGVDTASFEDLQTTGVTVNLVAGTAVGSESGSDTLFAVENVRGSDLADVLTGDGAANRLEGRAGQDVLSGGAGDDALDGGSSNDLLVGEDGNDTLDGGTSDDNLVGGAGADTLIGGAGIDTAWYYNVPVGGRLIVDMLNAGVGTGDAAGDTFSGVERLVLTGGDDAAYGTNGTDYFVAGAGNDDLIGRGGADVFDGGDGVDTVWYSSTPGTGRLFVDLLNSSVGTGEAAGDQFFNIERVVGTSGDDGIWGTNNTDYLLGGAGNDDLIGRGGADVFDGGDGIDTVWFNSTAGGPRLLVDLLNASVGTGEAAGDVFVNVERVVGGAGDDAIWGTNSIDYLLGAGGNDDLIGRGGADVYDGGDGFDSVWYEQSAPAGQFLVIDMLSGARGTGEAAGDRFFNIERVIGTNGQEYLFGSDNGDAFSGLGGDDAVEGRGGNDVLDAGAGNDRISGGAGADTLVGGSGADAFVYFAASEGGDRIIDFATGVDHFEFVGSAFGLATGALAADRFVAGAAATAAQGQFIWNATAHTLSWDADGTGAGAAVLIASIDTNTVVASDLLIV